MNKKTIYRLILAAIAAVIFTASAFGQFSRTNQIFRPCSGSTTPASVRVTVAGGITFSPCSGQATTFGGNITGPVIFRVASGVNDYFQTSSSVGENYFAASVGSTFIHNAVQVFRFQPLGTFEMNRTITAGGTTGAQVINKPVGTVNFAAAATSVVVTNSTVSGTSIIFPVIRTADATCTFVKSVVPGSGTFTITLNAGCTAETSVGFMVTN